MQVRPRSSVDQSKTVLTSRSQVRILPGVPIFYGHTKPSNIYSISKGGYAKKLFDLFGKDRVEAELDEFLARRFFPRCGGGIGVARLISAATLAKG